MFDPETDKNAGTEALSGVAVREAQHPDQPTCLRCGFVVLPKPWGCKDPCANCGFNYPLGDCSD